MKKNEDIPRLEADEKIKIDIDFENLNIKKRRRFPFFVFLFLIVLAFISVFIFKRMQKNDLQENQSAIDVALDNSEVWQGAFVSEETFNACRESAVSVISGGRKCSGFVYSSDGWIATVEGCVNEDVRGQIEVVLFDGRRFLVEAFRQNRENGLVLMKINASELTAVSFSAEDSIFVGEELYTFCAFGELFEGGSLFSGKIAHTQRSVELCRYDGGVRKLSLFQIGILLTEEGVGAPLFNEDGNIVGIACAAYGDECYMVDYAFEFKRVENLLQSMKMGKRVE